MFFFKFAILNILMIILFAAAPTESRQFHAVQSQSNVRHAHLNETKLFTWATRHRYARKEKEKEEKIKQVDRNLLEIAYQFNGPIFVASFFLKVSERKKKKRNNFD